jgi:hypothetical protein
MLKFIQPDYRPDHPAVDPEPHEAGVLFIPSLEPTEESETDQPMICSMTWGASFEGLLDDYLKVS